MPEEKDKIDVNTKIISSNYDYKTTINCLNYEIKDQISKLLIILNNETKLPKQENTNIENFVNLTENSELVNKEEVMSVNHLNQDDLQDNRIDNDSLNAIFKNTSNELNYKPSITKTLVNSKEYFKFGAGVERETDFFQYYFQVAISLKVILMKERFLCICLPLETLIGKNSFFTRP